MALEEILRLVANMAIDTLEYIKFLAQAISSSTSMRHFSTEIRSYTPVNDFALPLVVGIHVTSLSSTYNNACIKQV